MHILGVSCATCLLGTAFVPKAQAEMNCLLFLFRAINDTHEEVQDRAGGESRSILFESGNYCWDIKYQKKMGSVQCRLDKSLLHTKRKL